MTNYTNLTGSLLGEIETQTTTGLGELTGDPFIAGILIIIVVVVLGYKLNINFNVQVLSGVTTLFIIGGTLLPDWIYWITLVPIGIYGGIIFSRIVHK
jgi:hypothetical protein